jgi:capsular exopolysaccharide synthesis family protein
LPGHGGAPADESAFNMADQITRSLSALRRYKWLMMAIIAVGTGVGYALTRLVDPKYSVSASIWVNRSPGATGPISSPGLVSDALSWPDLAKSFIVLDNVVSKLNLHVIPDTDGDSLLVRSLTPADSLKPGAYSLLIGDGGRSYTLVRKATERGQEDRVVERGGVGDSVGRSVGFLWQPSPELLRGKREVAFSVVTPREAAMTLMRSFVTSGPSQGGNIMRFTLGGTRPVLMAKTLNEIANEFVAQAGRLKTENLAAVSEVVDSQLVLAKQQLDAAEASFQSFKVNTITQPSENTIVTGGVQIAENPNLSKFFSDNITYKQTARDADVMKQILADAQQNGGRIRMEALRTLPLVLQANSPLSTEIGNLQALQAQLRVHQRDKTEAHPIVQDLEKKIERLEKEVIPSLARESYSQLQIQGDELNRRIQGQAEELRQIPARTVEEGRRARQVAVADKIYQDLSQRSVQARLARSQALPDVSILDMAVAPSRPSSDTKMGIFLVAIGASIGVAIALALLLDRLDKRFRYADQATRELGLDIMGAVPTLTNPRGSAARLQEATQLVESFRSLSLSVRSAFDGTGNIRFTVSSPGPGDGKSFISANLASALADGGFRTLLIDGDIRRGALHSVFAPMEQSPGLLDYLAGEAALNEIVRSTSHGNLFVVPCGRRRRHGPELLAGQGMTGLVRDLSTQFDAIVVDSAPLGAGIDPFALGVATGAMLVVLRTGETDRRLAQTRLEVLDRLPVRVLGAVLNDIGENPQFKYYYYLDGYGAIEDGDAKPAAIGAGNGKAHD